MTPDRVLGLSFDVEEWFHTGAMRPFHPPDSWPALESGVVEAVGIILDALEAHSARATFFFLGSVMDRCGSLAGEVASAGHEIASHGWGHLELVSAEPSDLEADLGMFRDSCARAGLPQPRGYRAPSFTVVPENSSWVVDTLLAYGYEYDSSVFPIRRRRHGMPGAPLHPFMLSGSRGAILELPVAVARFAGIGIPAGGGAWMRLFPGLLHRLLLARAAREGSPPVLYSHPWEYHLPLGKSRSYAPVVTLRQSLNAGRPMLGRLERILGSFRAVTLGELADDAGRTGSEPQGK
ncbi:DUF3473 domain-containing protein [Candidatus Fermentibacteria bacterium]|nr:DUF3473 domain-containing protein [Candidatus Fermentibacteria bacterium]